MPSKRVTLVHPDLPGQPITVSERAVAIHAESGWVEVDADELGVDVDLEDDEPDTDNS